MPGISRDSNYYRLLEFGLGGQLSSKTWQTFVDRFKDKYNMVNIEGFEWDKAQYSYTYEQLFAENAVATLPQYVDLESDGLDKSFGKFEIGKNKIPTQKHYYDLDRKIMYEMGQFFQEFGEAVFTEANKEIIRKLLFDSTRNLLQGNANAHTHQRMRIVSNGVLTLDEENSPRGLKGITFDFGVPTANKTENTGSRRWWTNAEHILANEGADSDPIEDLKTMRKIAKRDYKGGKVHFEMTEELYDDLTTHTKVLRRIGAASNPAVASDTTATIIVAQNMLPEQVKAYIEKLIGAPIVTRDSMAAVDKLNKKTGELEPVMIDNFNPLNVALIPDGTIGTIKGVKILALGSPTSIEARFDDGRTLLTQTFNDRIKTMRIESEMATLLVPNKPKYMWNKKVTA